MILLVRRFLSEEGGQDIVEYALLTAFFGIVAYVVFADFGTVVFNTYSSWIDPTTGVPSLWDPPAPAGS